MDLAATFASELVRVTRRWRTRADELLHLTGLTQARWITLLELARSGPMSQRDLAAKIGVEGPTCRLALNCKSATVALIFGS